MTEKPFVERDEMMFRFSLERAFVERWMAGGEGHIPQMPHIPGVGKSTRFHLPTVEAWLLRYFQKGGEPLAVGGASTRRRREGRAA